LAARYASKQTYNKHKGTRALKGVEKENETSKVELKNLIDEEISQM